MVVQLYGKCNGADVVFSKDASSGRWSAAVPASSNGTYIIELYAVDDAGNTAYFATIKAAYNTMTMCTEIEIVEVGAEFTLDEVERVLFGVSINTSVDYDLVMSLVVKCEVCGL